MSYYVYILTIVVERSVYEPHLPAHRAYLEQLHQAGTLVLSGPFADRCGGMVLIQAPSEAAARAVAEADPLVVAGVDRYELRQWRITGGEPQRVALETI